MASAEPARVECTRFLVGEEILREIPGNAFHLPGANWPFYWFWTPIRIEGRIFVGSSVMVFWVLPAFDCI